MIDTTEIHKCLNGVMIAPLRLSTFLEEDKDATSVPLEDKCSGDWQAAHHALYLEQDLLYPPEISELKETISPYSFLVVSNLPKRQAEVVFSIENTIELEVKRFEDGYFDGTQDHDPACTSVSRFEDTFIDVGMPLKKCVVAATNASLPATVPTITGSSNIWIRRKGRIMLPGEILEMTLGAPNAFADVYMSDRGRLADVMSNFVLAAALLASFSTDYVKCGQASEVQVVVPEGN